MHLFVHNYIGNSGLNQNYAIFKSPKEKEEETNQVRCSFAYMLVKRTSDCVVQNIQLYTHAGSEQVDKSHTY